MKLSCVFGILCSTWIKLVTGESIKLSNDLSFLKIGAVKAVLYLGASVIATRTFYVFCHI